MNPIEFEFFERPNGHNEFVEFLTSLPKRDQAELLGILDKTRTHGMLIAQRQQWVKKIDGNLYELRSKVSSNIQRALYFHVENGHYVITHGFTKKTQKTPKREIDHAKQIRKEYEDGK